MKTQLLLLQELQTIDARIQELSHATRALPEKLAPAKADLARLETIVAGEKLRLAETEAWRREQEDLIAREEEAVRAAKAKLSVAKTNRDYTAASREVDNKRRAISEREEEVLKVIDAIETTRAQIAAHETDIGTLRERIGEREAEILAEVAALQESSKADLAQREEVAKTVDPALLARYDHVVKRRGIAVVAVKDGACLGCHMSLPPQLNNILARFETIESCPSCHRLLYRIELLDSDSDSDAANETSEAEAGSAA